MLTNRFLTFMFISVQVTYSKIFDRCELAQTLLQKHYLTHEQVNLWVCIAQYQSGFNSGAVNYDSEGIGYHGLYQISDQYWCSSSYDGSGKECNMQCSHLQDDDLTDDFACISKIFVEHERLSGSGYNAWTAFKNYCSDNSVSVISDCFDSSLSNALLVPNKAYRQTASVKKQRTDISQNKVYHRCELARELHYMHEIPMEQIATWVCIAKHESGFNTSAEGRLNQDGSGDHGLFQISDIYWCSPPGLGWACGVSCAELKDSDITDDVRCIKTIYEEHQRLSGDGFNAWAVYRPYCQYRSEEYIDGCFGEDDQNSIIPFQAKPKHKPTGKIYDRCELANELRKKHKISMDHLATWVCIAYHESQYNTAAVGRLNADGSADHGIFQISDIYWCSPPGTGKGCGMTCAQLQDNDITDDVKCMRLIHEEHQRLFGDGFSAWAVYNPHCRGRSNQFIAGCFDEEFNNDVNIPPKRPAVTAPPITSRPIKPAVKRVGTGKIYHRCELARELYFTHLIPMEQVSTWVCIAKHESSFNTSAIGHLNSDGSGDHGLFQISDIYWCSPPGKGWVCGLSCAQLEDSDITDDVECMRKIHEEHQRLSGDGFNAWAVYKPYCSGRSEQYIIGCFDDNTIDKDKNSIFNSEYRPGVVAPTQTILKKADTFTTPNAKKSNGKVYSRCELAIELRDKHNIPIDQIATWVCIAHRESRYNTSAIGRLNADGSGDHGIFQISDIYWCSPPGKGWVCGLSCSDLEDDDITDDIQCMQIIYEEHQRLSGNGFNAWAVYQPYCKGRTDAYTDGCFSDETSTAPKITTTQAPQTTQAPKTSQTPRTAQTSRTTQAPRTTQTPSRTTQTPRTTYIPKTSQQAQRTTDGSRATQAPRTTQSPRITQVPRTIPRTTPTQRTTQTLRTTSTARTTSTSRTTTTPRITITTLSTTIPTTRQPSTTYNYRTVSKTSIQSAKHLTTTTKPSLSATSTIKSTSTTESPFAIYLNNFQTKKPSTFYKFSTASAATTNRSTKTTQRSYQFSQSTNQPTQRTTSKSLQFVRSSKSTTQASNIFLQIKQPTDTTLSNSDINNKFLSIVKLNKDKLFNNNLTTKNSLNYITSSSNYHPTIAQPSGEVQQINLFNSSLTSTYVTKQTTMKSSVLMTQRPFQSILDRTIAPIQSTILQTTTLTPRTKPNHDQHYSITKVPTGKTSTSFKFTLSPKSTVLPTRSASSLSLKQELSKQKPKSQFDKVFDLFVH